MKTVFAALLAAAIAGTYEVPVEKLNHTKDTLVVDETPGFHLLACKEEQKPQASLSLLCIAETDGGQRFLLAIPGEPTI